MLGGSGEGRDALVVPNASVVADKLDLSEKAFVPVTLPLARIRPVVDSALAWSACPRVWASAATFGMKLPALAQVAVTVEALVVGAAGGGRRAAGAGCGGRRALAATNATWAVFGSV